MTTTYTNITLLDIGQDEAADWLAENNYSGAVSPTLDDVTVVYDDVLREYADEDEPLEELLRLASELSYEFGCAAWLIVVDDAETLVYSLYVDGELLDTYGSKSGETPDGGDAEILADTFGAPKRAIKQVRAVLKREATDALERHKSLLSELNLPHLALGTSYESILDGELPSAIEDVDELIMVELDEDDE